MLYKFILIFLVLSGFSDVKGMRKGLSVKEMTPEQHLQAATQKYDSLVNIEKVYDRLIDSTRTIHLSDSIKNLAR